MNYLEKDQKDEKDRKRAAMVGTGTFHALLLLVFLMVSWTEPDPLPKPEPVEFIEFDYTGGSGSSGGSAAPNEASVPESNAATEEDLLTEEESEVVAPPKTNSTKPTNNTTKPSEPKPNQNALFGGNSNGNSTNGNSVGNNNGNGNGENGNSTGNNTGDGGLFKGTGAGIKGRQQVAFPKPPNPNYENGKIFFYIWVNKSGVVTRLQLDQAKSTANDAALIEACKKELLNKQIVNADATADAEQKGVYVFEFKVQ